MHGDGKVERASLIEPAGGDGVGAKCLQLLQRVQLGADGRRGGAATRRQFDNVAHNTLPKVDGRQ